MSNLDAAAIAEGRRLLEELAMFPQVSACERWLFERGDSLLSAAEELQRLRSVMLRAAAYVTPVRDHDKEEQHANDMAQSMSRIDELDDMVNDRVCDLECKIAQLESELDALRSTQKWSKEPPNWILAQSRDVPGEWRAESINVDGDGGCSVVIFSGLNAEANAKRFVEASPPPLPNTEGGE